MSATVFHGTLDWSKSPLFDPYRNESQKSPSTDHPDSHVGLRKRHLALVLVLLLTFLIVVNLVLTHVYSSGTPFVPTVPAREEVVGLEMAF